MKTKAFIAILLTALSVGSLSSTQSASPQEDLRQLDAEITQLRQEIATLRTEGQTLEDHLQLLARRIEHTELTLERLDTEIAALDAKVADLTLAIEARQEEIAKKRAAMVEIIRTIHHTDQTHPLVRILANGEGNLGGVFAALSLDAQISKELARTVETLRADIAILESEREERAKTLSEQEELKRLTQLAREEMLARQKQQADILAATRGSETLYEKLLTLRQKDAARIRTELYFLEDLGRGLPFEEALTLARKAGEAANVRPALLLAVLQKESHLGALVGTGNWQDDMHPRDWDAFFQICQELGLAPDTTPVSRKPDYGWGGAMGPAQFLPSTWLGWKARIQEISGHSPPSPWNIGDAFVATALKLAAAGADAKTYEAEWKAAMIYFAGGNWDKPQYGFYGDSVMALTEYFQEQIKILEASSSTQPVANRQ